MRSLIVDFDDRIHFGSREHYFHFLLGYLLPGIRAATRQYWVKEVCFVTCGPVMDPLIRQACEILKLPYRILEKDEREGMDPCCCRTVAADRWDLFFSNPGCWTSWLPWLGHIPGTFVNHLLQLRRTLTIFPDDRRANAVSYQDAKCLSLTKSNPSKRWLLLRRSSQPAYYDAGGLAEKSGYGLGRRFIRNLDSLGEAIEKAGIEVSFYEPGAHSFQHQITTFAMAKGIIGIRGAEFANLSWMRPGSNAVMIATPAEISETSKNLARALRIGFHTIPVENGYPVVDPDHLVALLQSLDTNG